MFHFSDRDELPAAAARDMANFRIYGPKSNATVPLVADGGVFGALAFGAIETPHRWTDEEIGTITATNRDGGGAEFAFTLPQRG